MGQRHQASTTTTRQRHPMHTGTALAHVVSWSLLVLSALWVSGETHDASFPSPHGLLPPRSPRAESRVTEGRDHTAQAVPAPQASPPAAVSSTLRELADPSLASTAARREQLKYLVRCALPAQITVYADAEGERFTFQGSMGLAPRWLTEAMTASEERWVSACLLAHVNYFGKPVQVSMRATPPPVPALESSDEEQTTFTIFEGGFFGNLFTAAPVAYTCQGMRTPEQAADPILQDRVCVQETGSTTAAGTPVTACRFLLTGHCEDPANFTVDGTYYSEVIFVYLKPSKR
jgi:hypothetical protein